MPARPADPTGGSRDRTSVQPTDSEDQWWLRPISLAEDAIHWLIAVLLVILAGYVLVRTVTDFFQAGRTFPERATGVVNGVLFVVIVMEILRTVMSHFESTGFQLKPFLIIGIISAVRHILTVGAQLSLAGERSFDAFRNAQIELGVNGGVVILLVIGLILVRRTDAADQPS